MISFSIRSVRFQTEVTLCLIVTSLNCLAFQPRLPTCESAYGEKLHRPYKIPSTYQDMADASKKRAAPAGGADKSAKKSKVNLCVSHSDHSKTDRVTETMACTS
jgi:hypothetical protein